VVYLEITYHRQTYDGLSAKWVRRKIKYINSWYSDVAMVNNFLNTPPTAGIDYANFTSFTLGFANDFAIINQDIANINQVNVLLDLDVLWMAAAGKSFSFE
jgi:hypothetical protein